MTICWRGRIRNTRSITSNAPPGRDGSSSFGQPRAISSSSERFSSSNSIQGCHPRPLKVAPRGTSVTTSNSQPLARSFLYPQRFTGLFHAVRLSLIKSIKRIVPVPAPLATGSGVRPHRRVCSCNGSGGASARTLQCHTFAFRSRRSTRMPELIDGRYGVTTCRSADTRYTSVRPPKADEVIAFARTSGWAINGHRPCCRGPRLPRRQPTRCSNAKLRGRKEDLKGEDGTRDDVLGQLPQISKLLRSRLGHYFTQYKEKTLVRRIQRRMQLLQVKTARRGLPHGP